MLDEILVAVEIIGRRLRRKWLKLHRYRFFMAT